MATASWACDCDWMATIYNTQGSNIDPESLAEPDTPDTVQHTALWGIAELVAYAVVQKKSLN